MPQTDTRIKAILHWLTHTLKLKIIDFKLASSDASFRRYFRVTHQQGQHIVMDAPPNKENTEPFIRIATLFSNAGVNVPDIVEQELNQGFLLLEDFGSKCYLDELNNNNAASLYQNVFDSLYTLQTKVQISDCQLPLYDEPLLTQEIALFHDWFLAKYLNISMPKDIIDKLNCFLVSSALDQTQVCVHRDYHSRNLMLLDKNSPGVIDFQDAVIGPVTYDLVSLLRDCYISWPEERIKHWVSLYYQQVSESGVIDTSPETFFQWFELMGLQRHLKAIGIFTRLNIRDYKPNYLADIPLTMNYVIQVCERYPELKEFNQFLQQTVLPRYQSVSKIKLNPS